MSMGRIKGERDPDAMCDNVLRQCELLDRTAHKLDDEIAGAERGLRAGEVSEDDVRDAYVKKTRAMIDVISQAVPYFDEVEHSEGGVAQNALDDIDAATKASVQYASRVQFRRSKKADLNEADQKAGELDAQLREVTQRHANAANDFYNARKQASVYTDKGTMSYAAGDGHEYLDFIESRDALVGQFEELKVKYQTYLTSMNQNTGAGDVASTKTDPLAAMNDEDLQEKLDEVNAWLSEGEAEQLRSKISVLRSQQEDFVRRWEQAADLGWIGEGVNLEELLQSVQHSATRWQQRLSSESERRTGSKSNRERFMEDDAKLLQWCRQERTNLEALQEPGHQQEFCASLLENINTMEENFKHLCETATVLLPCRDVERALVEVNEVWIFLQMYAFELQQQLMYEIHPTAKLEDEVRVFADWTKQLQDLVSGRNGIPSHVPSRTVTFGAGSSGTVIDRCEDIARRLERYRDLPHSLKAFSQRMEKIRSNYQALRQHVLAKLTFLSDTETVPEDRAVARTREYEEKCREIAKWQLDEGNKLQSWKGQLEHLTELRGMLEKRMMEVQREMEAAAPRNPGDDEF